jgi:hypothetical protein
LIPDPDSVMMLPKSSGLPDAGVPWHCAGAAGLPELDVAAEFPPPFPPAFEEDEHPAAASTATPTSAPTAARARMPRFSEWVM